ncbi:hypothetical protein [Actinomadura flavalba]|uniref:hypothetical protein n=1 Tax=Actinomadura flavalba TaxID=1120938 RepID=UPI00035F9E07|nr:hypothetical protein [Actinomadura flavalba]
MTGTMRAPRSRGALSGVLLVLFGLWGGLLPFVGPYFDFGFAPDATWVSTDARLQLSVAPAVATVLGGLILLAAANRALATFGAALAALAGVWFAVGHQVGALWDAGTVGEPLGTGQGVRIAESLSGFTGLGVVIVFYAALALGRFAVVGVREARRAEEETRPHVEEYERGPFVPGGPAPRTNTEAGSTQPIAVPSKGRYGREDDAPEPPPLPRRRDRAAAPEDGDERVAGSPPR